MMKSIICTLLLILSTGPCFSVMRPDNLDSLRNELSLAKEDTNKVSLLCDLGLGLLQSDPEKSKKTALEALELSKKLEYDRGIAASYNLLALNAEDKGGYDKAITFYFKALRTFEKEQDKENCANLYCNIGKVYHLQQDFEKAVEYISKGLGLFREIEDDYGKALCLNLLGLVYRDQNEDEKAVETHKKALEYAKINGYELMIAVISLNLAGDLDAVDNFELVIQSFNDALRAFVNMGDKKGEAISLNNLASTYLDNDMPAKAIELFIESIEKNRIIDLKALQASNYDLINQAYTLSGNYQKANEYALKLIALNDTLFNEAKARIITELETKYQVEKNEQALLIKEKEIKILEKDKKIDSYIFYSIIGFFMLLVISALGWFRAYKRRKSIEENNIRHQLDLYIKEVELLKLDGAPLVEVSLSGISRMDNNVLSERELEVLNEVSLGKTNKEISDTLYISINTVKTHLKKIYEKLDVKNRTQAVKKATTLKKK